MEDKIKSYESIENTANARIYAINAYTIYAEIIKCKQYKIRLSQSQFTYHTPTKKQKV